MLNDEQFHSEDRTSGPDITDTIGIDNDHVQASKWFAGNAGKKAEKEKKKKADVLETCYARNVTACKDDTGHNLGNL